jgi:hypothetical protein
MPGQPCRRVGSGKPFSLGPRKPGVKLADCGALPVHGQQVAPDRPQVGGKAGW